MESTTNREWLTREEAADIMEVALVTVDRYIKAGKLRAATLGDGSVRIEPESVRMLLLPRTSKSEAPSELGCWWVWLVAGLALFLPCQAYLWADSNGYIPHREQAVITASGNWLTGESKECTSAVLDQKAASAVGKDSGYALAFVNCDDGSGHNIPVTFYGRAEQPEYKMVSWRCVRNDSSFTCYETGGR